MTEQERPRGPIRWDERYGGDDYLFGTAPNDFLAGIIAQVPDGRLDVICLADGEGRNGVFLAERGYRVTGIDASTVGLAKARRLAEQKGVQVQWIHADLATHDLGEGAWDIVVSIFFHMPSEMRRAMHARVQRALRPGGYLIHEAYTPKQLEYRTGGPPVEDMLQTLSTLRADYPNLEFIHAEEKERDVYEGRGHAGHAAVVQLLARKPD